MPVANAIVWQSRITAPICDRLKADGLEPLFQKKTGLVVDAYFSGTKIKHLLDSHKGLRARARNGEILAGTIDCFLLWRLTGGRVHATDVSNASRTLLFDIHRLDWDPELLDILDVPRAMLPEVKPSSGVFGETDPELFGSPIPIAGCRRRSAGRDLRAGLLQAGHGEEHLRHRLLPAHEHRRQGGRVEQRTAHHRRLADRRSRHLLPRGLGVHRRRRGAVAARRPRAAASKSGDVEALAATVPDSGGVVFVPAFVGLGAPYWDPYARGTILGIERSTTRGHSRARCSSRCRSRPSTWWRRWSATPACELRELRVDGGASVDDLLMQNQADVLGKRVRRPVVNETTALGAAYLAGLGTGFWKNQADVERNWALDREFRPKMKARDRQDAVARWRRAVERSRGWAASS